MNVATSKTEFLKQHAAVWGAVAWPEGAVVSVCAQTGHRDKDRRSGFRTVGWAQATNPEAIWDLIEPASSAGQNTWLSVGGYRPGTATGSGRGKKADIVGLPALVVDLDVSSGVHAAGDRNPTRAEAEAWIAEAPAPTVTIFSGGGFHLWYALDSLIIPGTPECDQLLAQHKQMWTGFGLRDDRNIDAGVLADVSRILRPAGTWNPNQEAPVDLISADGPRYTTESLSDAMPFYVPPATTAASNASRPALLSPTRSTGSSTGPTSAPTSVSSERVGDRFAAAVAVGDLAVELFNADISLDGGLIFPRADGSFAPDANARLFNDADGVQRLTVFGDRVRDAFDHREEMQSWSSFDLLARGAGGYNTAARLIGRAERNGRWDITFYATARAALSRPIRQAFGLDVDTEDEDPSPVSGEVNEPVLELSLKTVISDEDVVGALVSAAVNSDDVPSLTSMVPVGEKAQTIADAVATRTAAKFELDDDGLVVHLWNGGKHGVYHTVRYQDAASVWHTREDRICSWVAFKSTQREVMSVDASGRRVRATDAAVEVTVATADGRVKSMDGFTVKEAHHPETVLDRLNVGVQLPVHATEVKRIANVLRSLGANGAGTDNVEVFGGMGWLKGYNGRWVYLASAGSVGAEGAVSGFEVGPPPRSEEGSQLEAQLTYGWDSIPQEPEQIRDAATAIPAFLAITPRSPAGFAMLGLAFAAPLALAERTSLFLVSPPDIGKSQALRAFQAFLTGSSFLATWTGGSLLTASALGAGIACRWARHGVSVWDDYRIPEANASRAAVMVAAVGNILQASYGSADSGSKSTVDGGLKAMTSSEAVAVISGEALPAGGTGVLSRTIAVELEPGDVVITPRGTSPFDVFRSSFGDRAHLIYGSYIQYLARQMESHGSLMKFRSANEAVRAANTPASGRSASNASVIAAGWAAFRDFAAEFGLLDLIPDDATTAGLIGELAGSNAELVTAANPAQLLIDAARDSIASSGGHLTLHDSGRPDRDLALKVGWQWSVRFQDQGIYEPRGPEIGVLSKDRQWVCIRNQAISDLRRRLQMTVPQGQIDAGFLPLVMGDTRPGAKVPRTFGDSRPRGYLVPSSMFDLGDD